MFSYTKEVAPLRGGQFTLTEDVNRNKPIRISLITLSIAVLSFATIGSIIYALSSSEGLSAYYRFKYRTIRTHGKGSNAARAACRANPFFNQKYAVLINIGLPSNQLRLQIMDLQQLKPVMRQRVMHGRSSGGLLATRFSNQVGSHKTALGRYVVVGEYTGKFGQAYRLAGLDNSNSNSLSRSIVLHSSKWVSNNRIGRSQGCPAVSTAALAAMKPYLREGTLVWIYK